MPDIEVTPNPQPDPPPPQEIITRETMQLGVISRYYASPKGELELWTSEDKKVTYIFFHGVLKMMADSGMVLGWKFIFFPDYVNIVNIVNDRVLIALPKGNYTVESDLAWHDFWDYDGSKLTGADIEFNELFGEANDDEGQRQHIIVTNNTDQPDPAGDRNSGEGVGDGGERARGD